MAQTVPFAFPALAQNTTEKRNVESSVNSQTEKGVRSDRILQFTQALIGCKDAPGILRERARSRDGTLGRLNKPYPHQFKFVKRMVTGKNRRMLMVHAPGTGKTFTFLLHVAARHITRRGKRQRVLISVPASCLQQWHSAVLDILNLPSKRVLATNRLNKLTEESISNHDVLIVTKETVGRAWSSCYEWVQAHHQNAQNHWVSQWDRKPGTSLHPLFTAQYTAVCIDELHFMRNCLTGWTKGHELVSKSAEEVVGLTATPVFNKPDDMMGLATAMDLPDEWKTGPKWFQDRKRTCVNVASICDFNNTYVDKVSDDILDLPPITHETVNFDVCVNPSNVADYNEILARARRLRYTIERSGNRANAQDRNKLMSYLQTMQQFLVSPLLARTGAVELQKSEELIREAAMDDTGALVALRNTLLDLNANGYGRILVAMCHTSLLKIAMQFLIRTSPEVGDIILYTGELSQKKRADAISLFLGGQKTVMLMSIDAGGTGLHLVPGSNAVVFWGSRPFSPMQVLQTSKRVHRIGQEMPVVVKHLIARGSVDFAIDLVHGDKLTLSKAITDDDVSELLDQGGRWRSTGRIVDACKFLSEDGTFSDKVEITEVEAVRGINAYRFAQPGRTCSPENLYSDVQRYRKVALINPESVKDLIMDLKPLPPSIAQALMASAARISTGALGAPGLTI